MHINTEFLVIIILSTVFILFTIGYFFESHFTCFLSVMILALLLLCSWHIFSKEMKIEKYYKFHIGYITDSEYYRRHLYHTGWHIYGEAGMTEEELIKYIEENKENEIFDGLHTKEISP